MIDKIELVLAKNNIDIPILIEKLCAISAVTGKKIPIFDKKMFKKVKSTDDLWKVLRNLGRIFNYELLWYIVEISECKEAQDVIVDFTGEKVGPLAVKNVDLAHCSTEKSLEEPRMPVLRIKVKFKESTLESQENAEKILSEVYSLSKFALHFQCIKNSCELVYHISDPLKKYLLQFEITQDIMAEFFSHHINSIYIDEFELKIPSTSVDLMVSSMLIYW